MKATLINLAVAGLAAGQTWNFAGQPDCAIPCLRDVWPQTGCNPADYACTCREDTQRKLMGIVTPCIAPKCNQDEVARCQTANYNVCAQAGYLRPSVPAGAPAPGTPGGPAVGVPSVPAGVPGVPAGAPGFTPPGAAGFPPPPGNPGLPPQGVPQPGSPGYQGAGGPWVAGSWVGGVPVSGANPGHPWPTPPNQGAAPTGVPGWHSSSWDDEYYSSSPWASPTTTYSAPSGLITSFFRTGPDGSVTATATASNDFSSSTTFGAARITGAASGGPAAGALAAALAL